MSARVISTRPGLVRSAVRAIRLRWLRWQLDCVLNERARYTAAGIVGPIYQCASTEQELGLRALIRQLEQQ